MRKLSRRQTLASILAAGAGFAAPATRAAPAADSAARLSFLLVNDVYLMDEKNGRGGMARFAAAVKVERERARATNRRLFCVHAGDTLSPSPMSSLDEGEHMIELFNEVGLDYFVPGNHEFDFGKEVYFKRMAEASFQILAANLRDAAGLELPGHKDQKMFEVDGVMVALIGATYEQTPAVSNPGDLLFTKTKRAVVDNAERARAAGADFVAAVVHAKKTASAVLMNVHKVDLILSGHNHDLHIDFDGRTALVESEQDANYVTVIDIDFAKERDEATRALPWWPNFRVIDTAKLVPDPSTLAKVRDYGARLQKELDVEIATLAAPLDSRTASVRLGECAIGDLIADALQKTTSADVAIINGGTIRREKYYPADTKLTRRDILDELPFNNKTVLMNVSGKDIWDALENGFSELPDPSGRFPQVSGLSVVVDQEARPGKRVKSVTVNGEKLDLGREYKLATNDFMALGRDGYQMFARKVGVTKDSGKSLVTFDVIAYVEKLKLIDAKVEGRIVFR